MIALAPRVHGMNRLNELETESNIEKDRTSPEINIILLQLNELIKDGKENVSPETPDQMYL